MFIGRSGTLAKIALVFPGSYEASITSLVTHIAYYMLGSDQEILVDRFTLDNIRLGAIYSLDLRKFDVVLLTLSYELDYASALKILLANRIDPIATSRTKPVIIAGGPAISANPLPMSKFLDAVVIGEGEEFFRLLPNLCTLLPNKRAFLETLSSKGVYVPSLHEGERVRKHYVQDLNNTFYPLYQIRSLVREPIFGEGYIMEISRGCPHLCSFCMESFITYPYRIRSYEKIMSYITRGLELNRVERVIFYSLSFFDHPLADKLLEELRSMNVKYSIPSLRADTLNEHRVRLINSGGQKTLTLAPETNSPKLKCVIRKNVSEDVIFRVVNEGLKLGMEIKMYYIIGLPYESMDDINESIKFLKSLVDLLKRYEKRVRLTVNPLIPKAGTPMQYFPLVSRKEYLSRLKVMKKELPEKYFQIDPLSYNIAYAQTVIGLGGREISELLLKWSINGLRISNLKLAMSELSLNDNFIFRFKDVSENLPWDFIDLGLNVKMLYERLA